MFALPARSVLRYNHGRNTTGLIMSIWSIAMMLAFNAAHILGPGLTFIPFISPVLIFIWPELVLNYVVVQYRSPFLLGLCALFLITQIVHIIRQKRSDIHRTDQNKRGESLINLALPKSRKVNEYWLQCIGEPLLLIIIGYAVFASTGDLTFFADFMSLSALSIFMQETADGLFRTYHSRR